MMTLFTGKGFTYVIMALYAARCVSYVAGGHYGRACYWLCALGITISAEFLMTKWP
jgi:hypothetical protein